MMTLSFILVLFLSLQSEALPKYGPNAIPLFKEPNRDYFKRHDAKDFWALISYYLPQPNDTSCSATSFVTVLNAARNKMDLGSQDELITYDSLLEKYTDERYKTVMKGDLAKKLAIGFNHADVSNERLAEVLALALKKTKLWNSKTSIETVRIDQMGVEEARKHFHETLVMNEKSDDDFIVISYVQGLVTGDPEGLAAHVAVIGAYDEEKKWVLLLDPDRKWYGPYWVPEEKLFESIADKRSDDKHPGWLYIKVR